MITMETLNNAVDEAVAAMSNEDGDTVLEQLGQVEHYQELVHQLGMFVGAQVSQLVAEHGCEHAEHGQANRGRILVTTMFALALRAGHTLGKQDALNALDAGQAAIDELTNPQEPGSGMYL